MTLAARDLCLQGRLHGVMATLRQGEVTAICGPNGAGKTSLLACMAGLLVPDAGDVILDGHSLATFSARDRARAIGYLPQTPELAWDLSVETLVSLGRLPWPDGAGAGAIDAALEAMDLVAMRQRPVSQLSGGERARALLARVLTGEPRWLLADEPLANLDLAHAARLMAALHDTARAGAGVVLVLHDLATAMNHADRLLVIDSGKLVADGPPDRVLEEDLIARVWGISVRWLGDPGSRALSLSLPLA